uniref:ANK_REP_REGION domain-containing protein n=1 Tax=Heterorhabditis bacteriophora TaxID=37862 RepID=A0A1I7XP50_HETBA
MIQVEISWDDILDYRVVDGGMAFVTIFGVMTRIFPLLLCHLSIVLSFRFMIGWDHVEMSRVSETSETDCDRREGVDALKKKRPGEQSRSSSPSVVPTLYPVSVRQQLALIKQMEQPSPSGSIDGDGTIPTSRKRVSRVHKKNDRGETPLHVAARKGDGALCAQLLAEGYFYRFNYKRIQLKIQVTSCEINLIIWLLTGAEVNCGDYAGWTPLHEACSHDRFSTAEVNGANVNLSSLDDDTPLHDAALIWLLLKHGADRELRNKAHKRAIDLCDEDTEAHCLLASEHLPEKCPSESPPYSLESAVGNSVDQDKDDSEPILSTEDCTVRSIDMEYGMRIPIDMPISVFVSSPSHLQTESVLLERDGTSAVVEQDLLMSKCNNTTSKNTLFSSEPVCDMSLTEHEEDHFEDSLPSSLSREDPSDTHKKIQNQLKNTGVELSPEALDPSADIMQVSEEAVSNDRHTDCGQVCLSFIVFKITL